MRTQLTPANASFTSTRQTAESGQTPRENILSPSPRDAEGWASKSWFMDADALPMNLGGAELGEIDAEKRPWGDNRKILDELKALEKDPAALRDRVCAMDDVQFRSFLSGLKRSDRHENGPFIQLLVTMHSTGMTLDEMGAEQLRFLGKKAAEAGKTVGGLIQNRVATTGYGGGDSKKWDSLSPTEKQAWQDKFDMVVADIKRQAPADVLAIIEQAERNGGGFVFAPAECEKGGAFAYTRGDWKLYCGTEFVDVASKGAARIFPNIVHEIGGHNIYGSSKLSMEIMKRLLEQLPEEDRKLANASGNSLYSAYGYMETEIYAELYEWSYAGPDNPTDFPFPEGRRGKDLEPYMRGKPADVPDKLSRMKDAFAPKLAKAMAEGLVARVEADSFIQPRAKALLREAVAATFDPVV